ncbi:MAG: hypothetical protein GF383_06375, partial [Candidatus Lokiarchaeota archaeon]|nr:hypothetical protein [Candidatus Lokiarchaeota archaeon]MBD3339662.1 hypothetical protein [Candidatus Lokiarchaeota archaeon]
MKVNYQYPSPSMCFQQENLTVLGLSPDLSREEKVSFIGRLKHPLVYRDAMLMLREIVISDMGHKKKERVEFYAWLENEIKRRVLEHEKFMPEVRDKLSTQMNELVKDLEKKESEIRKLSQLKNDLQKNIEDKDIWKEYYKIERDFWSFIRTRDIALWWILDPVITVHPDQISFEAFSLDESTYGCLSIDRQEFKTKGTPKLGTTNIDFSAKLAREMARFRTYTQVELSINPEGFTIDSGIMPEYLEKKIDLPETWIKGFNQVSAAACLEGIDIELNPIDMYDICSFLRRHKARKSPRDMRWILKPNKRIKIILEPWKKTLELTAVYKGNTYREERIWGRRRWLVLEKIIPITESFIVRLLGFGMPQFIIANMGSFKMTVGFTSWSANDWVKGTAFNVLAGFIGEGNYDKVYELMKEKRVLSMTEINESLDDFDEETNRSGIGMLLRRGEAYYDPLIKKYRFRHLCNVPIPEKLYEVSELEKNVESHIKQPLGNLHIEVNADQQLEVSNVYTIRGNAHTLTILQFDQDRQISKVKCDCREFKRGSKNISSPCSHILALYITSMNFLNFTFEPEKEYNIQDLEEIIR